MGEVIKVFGCWVSPYSKRVEMALKLKGIEYEYIEEDLKNKSGSLLKYNPVYKKVPVLLHNTRPVAESLIILEYIDDTWREGPAILPQDPYQRANARFWAKFIDDKCTPTIWTACSSKGEEREKAYEEAHEALRILENEINGKKFFGGDNVGLVDLAANFIAYWSRILSEVLGVDFLSKDKYPNLCRWADDFCNCSFVKETVPPKDKMVENLKNVK